MKKRMMSALLFIATTMVVSAQTRDLTIGDMFQLIEQNSKSLRQQKTSAAVAEEGVKSAKSQQLPDIDAQLSASYIGNAVLTDRDFTNVHGLKTPHFGNTFNLDVQQTIYAGGAISAGIKMAELGVEQANLGTEQHRQDQRFLALGEYLSLQKLSNRAKVIQSNIELTQKLIDRKSTRLNSSHQIISYAVFCLKKKKSVDRQLRGTQGSEDRIIKHTE